MVIFGTEKHRLFLIDFLRVICAFLIYARHSITIFGCTWGNSTIDAFIKYTTSPVMTCFFIISGFSIHYQHRKETISEEWTKNYLIKRLIGIMPSYLLVCFLWPIVFPGQIVTWIQLLPVDLLGIQTSYNSLFGILHNGGTWFISCLLAGYFIYPVLKAILHASKTRFLPYAIIIVLNAILLYNNYLVPTFGLDGWYSSPIGRAFEFTIGVCFSELLFDISENDKTDDSNKNWVIKLSGLFFTLLVVSYLLALVNDVSLPVILFVYFSTIIILIYLFLSAVIRSEWLEKNKLLSIFSGMSYQFFLAQLFLWTLSAKVIGLLGIEGNLIKLIVSFLLCVILSFVVWKYYDKPIRKVLSKRFL